MIFSSIKKHETWFFSKIEERKMTAVSGEWWHAHVKTQLCKVQYKWKQEALL